MNESSIGTRRFRIIRQIFEGLRKSKYQFGITDHIPGIYPFHFSPPIPNVSLV